MSVAISVQACTPDSSKPASRCSLPWSDSAASWSVQPVCCLPFCWVLQQADWQRSSMVLQQGSPCESNAVRPSLSLRARLDLSLPGRHCEGGSRGAGATKSTGSPQMLSAGTRCWLSVPAISMPGQSDALAATFACRCGGETARTTALQRSRS